MWDPDKGLFRAGDKDLSITAQDIYFLGGISPCGICEAAHLIDQYYNGDMSALRSMKILISHHMSLRVRAITIVVVKVLGVAYPNRIIGGQVLLVE